MKELKIRCGGFAEVEQKLRKMEAQKVGEGKERAAYFDTEGRGGLKIVQEEKEARMGLAAYDEENGCFDIVSSGVGDAGGTRRIFNKLFSNVGQVVLEKKVYKLGDLEVWLAHIDQLGNFVLIQGESEERLHELAGKLGFEPDKIVKENFAEMLFKAGKKL
ncbi:MAG: hypothetical protein GY852_03990 [bacterium]|nr:hypothetical protein [bacterium]